MLNTLILPGSSFLYCPEMVTLRPIHPLNPAYFMRSASLIISSVTCPCSSVIEYIIFAGNPDSGGGSPHTTLNQPVNTTCCDCSSAGGAADAETSHNRPIKMTDKFLAKYFTVQSCLFCLIWKYPPLTVVYYSILCRCAYVYKPYLIRMVPPAKVLLNSELSTMIYVESIIAPR